MKLAGTILHADECSWTMRYWTFNWHTCNRPSVMAEFWCDCRFLMGKWH